MANEELRIWGIHTTDDSLFLHDKLCEAAIDPSHYVRSQVLNLCKSKKIKAPEICDELFGILTNDANYAIRVGCK